jgi:hypothetical protein
MTPPSSPWKEVAELLHAPGALADLAADGVGGDGGFQPGLVRTTRTFAKP